MRRFALALVMIAAVSGTCAIGPAGSRASRVLSSRAASGSGSVATPVDASVPANPDPSTAPSPSASSVTSALAPPPPPLGTATPIARYSCPNVQRGGPFRSFLASADTKYAFVDGDDALALVNRSPTGALAPAYAPSDLVDLSDGRPRTAAQCDASRECLRRDAAAALKTMLNEMRIAKMPGSVVSSFRGFGTQCWVFANWASKARGGFCEATEQSALPGHSQHQLGTTVDLFTNDWQVAGMRSGQGVFRNGFGCTAGGQWLDENAWRFGFVLPYPIHPDDRKDGSRCEARRDHPVPIDPKTGYKNEPWHLRFVGVDAATRYHDAWLASGPGTIDEITLEQWLRGGRGLAGDAELPVCDGCQCGACATLAEDDAGTPCGKESLRLDAVGRVVMPAEPPHIVDARAVDAGDGTTRIEVTVHVPPHTPTQPPVMDATGPIYRAGATYVALAPAAGVDARKYVDLPGAWRLAVAIGSGNGGRNGSGKGHGAAGAPSAGAPRWPWRASLADPKLSDTWNRANVVLPAKSGDGVVVVRVTPPPATKALRVTLLHDGAEHETREIDVN